MPEKKEEILRGALLGKTRIRVVRYEDGSVGLFWQYAEKGRWLNENLENFDPEESEALRQFLNTTR